MSSTWNCYSGSQERSHDDPRFRNSVTDRAPSLRASHVAARTALVLLLGPLALILLFRFLPVPLTPLMVIRVLQGYGLHHSWIAYDRIAPVLARAVVASEDNFFCREALGFDEDALLG